MIDKGDRVTIAVAALQPCRTSSGGGVIFEEGFETPGLTTRTTIGGSRCASPVTGPWRSPAWTCARCSLAGAVLLAVGPCGLRLAARRPRTRL